MPRKLSLTGPSAEAADEIFRVILRQLSRRIPRVHLAARVVAS